MFDRSLIPSGHKWRFVSLDFIIFWNIWKIFCSVWYLMLAFVLWMLSKIFRANISTYINFSWRLCSCLQWWCWHLEAKLQATHLPMLTFGWRKGAAADASFGWRKNAASNACFGWWKIVMGFGKKSSFSTNVSWWSFSYFLFAI